eukprot:87885-Amphidinium_carterae.1
MRLVPHVQLRGYVDDITVWSRGKPAPTARTAAEACGTLKELADSLGFALQLLKTKAWSTSASSRKCLPALLPDGVGVAAVVRDLGIDLRLHG